jgi:hypothetical protein
VVEVLLKAGANPDKEWHSNTYGLIEVADLALSFYLW